MAKSPNCASHSVRELGDSIEKPSSNPSTPNSDRDELEMVSCPGFCPGKTLASDVYFSPV